MISQMSLEEYKKYQADLKRERDNFAVMEGAEILGYNRGIAEGLAKGEAKGLAKGLAKGKAEGKIEEKLQNAKAMKALGVPFETISKGFGLSIQEIEAL